ncbi:hypothetical protein [Hominenteromicrobium sp.]|uniref:hypothetical protein n=1 Tax=Hominenteromicrobium sp. TaxID=3073581 RepID=UPI003A8F28C8
MLKSLKQLLRTPVKTLLFLLLLAASTVLLVLGAGLLIRTNARIDAAEGEFKTVGTVTQKSISEATVPVTNTCSDYLNTYTVQTFKEILSPDILNFDGAEYKIAPRNRAYYLSVMPELNNTNSRYGYRDEVYILEFTPLAVNDGKTTVRVKNVLYKHETTPYFPPMQVGNEIEICAHFAEEKPTFELGKTLHCNGRREYRGERARRKNGICVSLHAVHDAVQCGRHADAERCARRGARGL